MRTTTFKLYSLLVIGAVLLSACNMPGNVAVEETATASPRPATETPEPSATPTEAPPTDTPTETATETPLSTPTDTATPVPPMAEVNRESNCRVGPGGVYDLVATYQAEKILEVVAKDLGGGYWFVRNPDLPEEQCYLLGQNITITGDTASLPQFTPRPSPTAAPYFTIEFWKFDICQGRNFAVFNVTNVGSLPFRSHYIRITDQKVNQSVEQVSNAFDLRVGCVLARNIAPLEVGGTGYISSPVFTWNAINNRLQVVIQLCTEQDLKGTCVIQTLRIN